jgi:hypothetical protein
MTPSAVHRLRAWAVELSLVVARWLPRRLRRPARPPDERIPEHLWRALSPEEDDVELERTRRDRWLLAGAAVLVAVILGALWISGTA